MKRFSASGWCSGYFQHIAPICSVAAVVSALYTGGAGAEIIINGGAAFAPPSAIAGNNGVPVINIVSPNGNGISHNRFDRFNVERPGVIFNNSLVRGESQLGGILDANPNLRQSARLILSEVTGTEVSSISGALEVFGAKADLIIANPNGLILNGVRTLNAGGLTVTTGVTGLTDQLQFSVEGNDARVVVGAGGVDTHGLSYFDVVARVIELNGQIGTPESDADINIIAGLNRYDAQSRTSSRLANSDHALPRIAIEGSAAGAMYGRHITLISTESGPGVRHAGAIRSKGDIVISAAGDIELVRVDSQQSTDPTRPAFEPSGLVAQGNIRLWADEAITVDAGIWAQGDFSANSARDLVIKDAIGAGGRLAVAARNVDVDSTASLTALGQIALQANDSVVIQRGADIAASGDVEITAGDALSTAANIDAGARTTLRSGGNLTNTGVIFSDSLDMTSGRHLINDEGALLFATQTIRLGSGGYLLNRNGSMIYGGDEVLINATGMATNDLNSMIAGRRVNITSNEVYNRRDSLIHGIETLNIIGRVLNTEGGQLMENGEILSDSSALRF